MTLSLAFPPLNLENNYSSWPKHAVCVRTDRQPILWCCGVYDSSWWYLCLSELYLIKEVTSLSHPGHWAGPHTRHRCVMSWKGDFSLFYFGFFPPHKHSSKWMQRNNQAVPGLHVSSLLPCIYVLSDAPCCQLQLISGPKTNSTEPCPQTPPHTCLRIKDLKVKGIRSNIQPFKENGFLEVKSPNLPSSSPPQQFLIRHLGTTGLEVVTAVQRRKSDFLCWGNLSEGIDWTAMMIER